MISRLALLAAVLTLAWAIVWLWERRRTAAPRLLPGITVVTGPHCRLCDPVISAIRSADPDADLRIVDVSHITDGSVRSLPTVFVMDESHDLVMRRSGKAALADAAVIAAAARERGAPQRASRAS